MQTNDNRTATQHLRMLASWLLLVLFIAGVEYWLGWSTVLEPWSGFNLWQVLMALGLLIVSYALRAWRMYDYFPNYLRGYWLQTWRVMLIHNALNNLLPARTGELSFPLLMKRYFGVGYTHSLSALLWFRLLDLHAVLSFAIFPLLILSPLRRFAIPLMVVWLFVPVVVFMLRNRLESKVAHKTGKFNSLLEKAVYGLPDDWWMFWRSWAMTWANWLVKLMVLAWLLGQFVSGPSWNLLITSVVSGELTSVLPFHAPGGFGTYEAGIVAPLLHLVDAKLATAGAVNVHLFVLGASLIGGILGWLIPLHKKDDVAGE